MFSSHEIFISCSNLHTIVVCINIMIFLNFFIYPQLHNSSENIVTILFFFLFNIQTKIRSECEVMKKKHFFHSKQKLNYIITENVICILGFPQKFWINYHCQSIHTSRVVMIRG